MMQSIRSSITIKGMFIPNAATIAAMKVAREGDLMSDQENIFDKEIRQVLNSLN